MISLKVQNYGAPYEYLNEKKAMPASPFDMARAMITTGKGNMHDVFGLGIFRIGELICKALAFCKLDNGKLLLHSRFYNLNQSEKATVSYYFGQALTKLFSEECFKIPWLLHVDDYKDSIHFNSAGVANSKIQIATTKKNAARPDLIGIRKANVSHIFEAKANSLGYNKGVMQHAINQVSQVLSYNGVTPLTRTACYFDLSGSSINGIIIDPENDEGGINLIVSEVAAITQYYSFFVSNREYFTNSIKVGGYEFLTTPLVRPHLFFGFDARILQSNVAELLANGLYTDESNFIEKNVRFNGISIGLDGLILVDELNY